MIVIVCGGRDYYNKMAMKAALDSIHAETPITLLVQGEAAGADRLAKYWAASAGVKCEGIEADWSVGKSAGPIRNEQMLIKYKPQLVVAFPGGRGTASMKRLAREYKVRVIEVEDKTI